MIARLMKIIFESRRQFGLGWAIGMMLLSTSLAWPASPDGEGYDAMGGWKGLKSTPKRFFYVEQIQGTWWFIDPAGSVFLSKGVNHVSYTADFSPDLGYSPYARATEKKYGNAEAWSKAAAANLRAWRFNTIGAWCNPSMNQQEIPYTFILNIGSRAGANWVSGVFPDVFTDAFVQAVRNVVLRECRSRRDDLHLLGYFTDNELRWGADWRKRHALLFDFLALPEDAPGRRRVHEFLNSRYAAIEALNQAWNTKVSRLDELASLQDLPESEARVRDENAFLEILAARYFQVCHDAIRAEDPNHLILGCRFGGYAPEPVLRAMKDYVDVISYNTYNATPPKEVLDKIHSLTGRPIVITEFAFKAMDSGLPNTKGAGKPVPTQADRARLFTGFVTELMKIPYVIGYHWFEYADEPAEGRFDGENSNYGLVNLQDEPWETLTAEMTQTNARMESVHAGTATP